VKIGLLEILPGFGGGNIYQKYVVQALKKEHDVTLFKVDTHPWLGFRLGKIYNSSRIMCAHSEIDLWICVYYPTIALSLGRPRGKVVNLFYHYDESIHPNLILAEILWEIYLAQARKCASVVCIAEYWRNYLKDQHIQNSDLIYWGFDVTAFEFSQESILDFKKKYSLLEKPIIYLGNCQERKGVVDAYEQLKDFNAHLVTSGEPQVKINARNLTLDYKEYCLLLAASDVVLTLSKFKEGWNATAHEALLAGTPVIGSGLGGMYELLKMAGQLVCADNNQLTNLVTYALGHKLELGEKGRLYASQFTFERFDEAWLNLIKQVTSS
jgi:glycosyltransferase involved in cell wall biosynthesis